MHYCYIRKDLSLTSPRASYHHSIGGNAFLCLELQVSLPFGKRGRRAFTGEAKRKEYLKICGLCIKF